MPSLTWEKFMYNRRINTYMKFLAAILILALFPFLFGFHKSYTKDFNAAYQMATVDLNIVSGLGCSDPALPLAEQSLNNDVDTLNAIVQKMSDKEYHNENIDKQLKDFQSKYDSIFLDKANCQTNPDFDKDFVKS